MQLAPDNISGAGANKNATQWWHFCSSLLIRPYHFAPAGFQQCVSPILVSPNYLSWNMTTLGWDATCCNHIASWAQLQDRQTGRKFYFFSVHFDHEGEVARRESAKLMLRKVKEIAGSEPVIVAGDLNSVPETEQVAIMKSRLADAFDISAKPAYGPVLSYATLTD
ncbi:hypothetical protein [Pseudoduganella sp. R-34]|uniref:hypothetical protein n=1 Tax=Pseudoduganella sp. R-34 TaxID=3404062 RepID=UPI003CFA99DD